jgi:hypothetical protein
MNDPLKPILRAWLERRITAVLSELDLEDGITTTVIAQQTATPAIETQLGKIMATLTDIQNQETANAETETAVITAIGTLISDLTTLTASNASLTAQLTAATSANDSAAITTIVTQMQADQVKMQTALAAATAAIGKLPATATPVPPGQPTIG